MGQNLIEFSELHYDGKLYKAYFEDITNSIRIIIKVNDVDYSLIIPEKIDLVPLKDDWLSKAIRYASVTHANNFSITKFIPCMIQRNKYTTVAGYLDLDNLELRYLDKNRGINLVVEG